ncbi:hypothetical protein [Rhizobium sp. BK176]|uniref:hypothetical protein n=1 Tax=Rhizobium sp. BK176 TaxID=2587071 RepID=UPI0021683296|nr:hypothetical protein [Rhizobium sp. BK176]MCS4088461.1 hypothetical protein [Rhizobium sp. BK176]
MRTHFTSEKRPSNLSRRLRSSLETMGLPRTMSACREAIAKGSGYRNWNEMLNFISNDTIGSREQHFTDGTHSLQREFSEKFAAALDVPMSVARAATDMIKPFEEARLTELTDGHIRLLAANICDTGYEIEDVSVPEYAGFKITKPKKTVFGAGMGRQISLYVSHDGRKIYDHEPRGDRRSLYGSDGFTEIMEFAKLTELPVTPPVRVIEGEKIELVYETLRRMDKKVLLFMKHAGDFDCWAYRDAVVSLEGSPLFGLASKYPGLASQYTSYHRWGTDPYIKETPKAVEKRQRVFAPDPISAFSDYVDSRQKYLWPEAAVPMERVRAVSEAYLSVPVNTAYVVTADAPAFMCHLPDALFPRNTGDMEALVDFVDRHLHVFEPDGMCVAPTTFASEFAKRVDGDWSRVRELSDIEYISAHPHLGSTVLGVAAREAGYDVSAADFEDLRDENADLRFTVGHLLAKDACLDFFKVADGLKRVDAARRPVDLIAEATREDDFLEEASQFAKYREVGLIHPKHSGASATDILASIGYDIEEIIGSFDDEPERLPSAYTPAVPTY